MAELLAPAGNPEALDAAVNEGCDAVYLGLKSFNARLRSSNFAWSQFEATLEALHKRGKKVLVTVNTVLQEHESERMYRFLAYLDRMGPDGIIVQDFGVLDMARAHFPKLRIHASTQMNVASAKAANAMGRAGVSRVVLARELGLSEIREIKERTSCELEVFVHGALCVSESGLCLYSSYLGGKSANRGLCTQACRRLYSAEVTGGARQGYFFSPHDLQLIDKIPDLVQAGVHSFKIEGRMKSAEYVGTVVSAYRYVLDHWQEDRKGAVETGRRILANDFARAKTRYWYDSSKAENILNPSQAGGTGIFLGKVETVVEDGGVNYALLRGGNYDPDVGDSVRFHKKDDSARSSHKIAAVREDRGSRMIDLPEGFGRGDSVYLLQTKAMSKRYPHVLPNDLGSYRSQPGGEKLPELKLAPIPVPAKKLPGKPHPEDETGFPEGIYVQVSYPEDLYTILADRPVRVIVELNAKTGAALLGQNGPDGGTNAGPLPFSKREIIVSLDPFLPQSEEDGLSTTIDRLVENGYTQFILNNPGHIGMLRNRSLKLIAGPYLYTFNRWAVNWLNGQGLFNLITPLENSRANLEATLDPANRKQALITVFSYPALFRMRFKLPDDYEFTYFNDRQGGRFRAVSGEGGSFVMPDVPFSIIDKIPHVKKAGFTRFVLDFSHTPVKKQDYRAIMESYRKDKPLLNVSRFNWKDGFYNPDQIEEYRQMNERSGKAGAGSGRAGAGTGKAVAARGAGARKPGPGAAKGKAPAEGKDPKQGSPRSVAGKRGGGKDSGGKPSRPPRRGK